eukprot:gene20928-25102_t
MAKTDRFGFEKYSFSDKKNGVKRYDNDYSRFSSIGKDILDDHQKVYEPPRVVPPRASLSEKLKQGSKGKQNGQVKDKLENKLDEMNRAAAILEEQERELDALQTNPEKLIDMMEANGVKPEQLEEAMKTGDMSSIQDILAKQLNLPSDPALDKTLEKVDDVATAVKVAKALPTATTDDEIDKAENAIAEAEKALERNNEPYSMSGAAVGTCRPASAK